MKRLLLTLLLCLPLLSVPAQQRMPVNGAWKRDADDKEHLLLFTNHHYTYTIYNSAEKKFYHSEGGSWSTSQGDGKISTVTEFNTSDKAAVGKQADIQISMKNGSLYVKSNGREEQWTRIDEGSGPLNATWRISDREQKGEMYSIPRGARKTIKILTGSRFQWAAINTDTGEFFGTGGGTYTFKDGRYTEKIEFFSRDSSRVGMQLSFQGKVEGDKWHHKGKSSKGDPIYEIWTRED